MVENTVSGLIVWFGTHRHTWATPWGNCSPHSLLCVRENGLIAWIWPVIWKGSKLMPAADYATVMQDTLFNWLRHGEPNESIASCCAWVSHMEPLLSLPFKVCEKCRNWLSSSCFAKGVHGATKVFQLGWSSYLASLKKATCSSVHISCISLSPVPFVLPCCPKARTSVFVHMHELLKESSVWITLKQSHPLAPQHQVSHKCEVRAFCKIRMLVIRNAYQPSAKINKLSRCGDLLNWCHYWYILPTFLRNVAMLIPHQSITIYPFLPSAITISVRKSHTSPSLFDFSLETIISALLKDYFRT